MEIEKFDRSRNKVVKKAVKSLRDQGAEVIEVYINLFNNLVTIHFKYKDRSYKILDELVGDNIDETILRVLKN